MNFDLTSLLESVRRGELVRIMTDKEACDSTSSAPAGHLVLAAEKATPQALTQLLRLADGPPVLATTRDRLEQLRIIGIPVVEEGNGNEGRKLENNGGSSDAGHMAAQLAVAAASLTNTHANLTNDALQSFTVRCVDWGGAVNCQQAYEAAVDLSRLAGLAPAAVVCRLGSRALDESSNTREFLELASVMIRQVVAHRRERSTSNLVRSGPSVRMPTRHGKFQLQAYEDTLTGQIHLALWTGELSEPVLTRVHSECLTGDLLGSMRCDCGTQLDQALARLVEEGSGILLYLRQEGRGIGLVNKLRTYDIQDHGFDTVEANERIGFEADLRDYSVAALMLVDLGVSSIRLLTNNPEKVRGLKKHGIRIEERVPLVVKPCSENSSYLEVKRTKMGHLYS